MMQREENKARGKEILHEGREKRNTERGGKRGTIGINERDYERDEREGKREWRHKNCGLSIERDFLCKRPAVTNLSDIYGKVGWRL